MENKAMFRTIGNMIYSDKFSINLGSLEFAFLGRMGGHAHNRDNSKGFHKSRSTVILDRQLSTELVTVSQLMHHLWVL